MQNRPDFSKQKQIAIDFLRTFKTQAKKSKSKKSKSKSKSAKSNSEIGVLKYLNLLTQVSNRNAKVINIELDDLKLFDQANELLPFVETNTVRYMSLFGDAIDEVLPQRDMNAQSNEDSFDVLKDWRNRMLAESDLNSQNEIASAEKGVPKELQRRYEIVFVPRSDAPRKVVRNIGAEDVGSLVTVEGIVTRVTDVRPLMKVATYSCNVCGNEIYQIINKNVYTPLQECPSQECQRNRNHRAVVAQSRQSKFVKFQQLRLQEAPEHVPQGNVPRSVSVYCMGEVTRKAQCGDKVTIAGVWLPIPYFGGGGFQSGGAAQSGLTANTYMHCMTIRKQKKGYAINEQDVNLLAKVDKMSEDVKIYEKLSRSIAPEIYGLEDVKKALLLLLTAGVTKQQATDGMKIRGDINILLMGDPGVAKSQLLKHLTHIAPRCVYTTGKGSSGVGLTAAVTRDPVTHDMLLEGGALVLADMGICCIDEFDKMEESDRTAIHEVMEQQTISIAKAGITTTLNARTAILAAANPAFGRYDKRRTPEQNINLPAALLSRFDLLFVLVDKPELDNDIALARHITHVHQYSKHPKLDFKPFKPDLMRAYISRARQHRPCVPVELTDYLVGCYVQMRMQSLDDNGQYNSNKIVGTPRALLSILRLSQALARLRFSDEVQQSDVSEAMRLMREAKHSTLQADEVDRQHQDTISSIYKLICNYVKQHATQADSSTARISEIKSMLTTRGFDQQQINHTLQIYERDDVWMISTDGETLSIMNN